MPPSRAARHRGERPRLRWRDYITRAPWIMLAPASIIVLTTLSVSLVGDWLRYPTLR